MVALFSRRRLVTGLLLLLPLFAEVARADEIRQVICREDGGKRSYRLQFGWAGGTVSVASRYGEADWKVAYKDGAAVRNPNPDDTSFYAEVTPKQYVGQVAGCGAFIETWLFDVAKTNAGLKGSLERTPQWVSTRGACKAKVPAPELASESVRLTCS